MPGRLSETAIVTALAVMVTLWLGLPVLRAPSERVFGAEIVGRHHDPFTVMQQFASRVSSATYAQPITDLTGRGLARIAGGVAAYNLLVLASFPLAAAAAHLLARHLGLSPVASAIAALAFAFSPFHLAQAAYHPHIAQVQWLPLYFLALWRCLDRATAGAIAFLVAAAVAVTLSNFYGGLIAAGLTPVAAIAYSFTTRQTRKPALVGLVATAGSLVMLAAAGMAYVWWTGGALVNHAELAFPRSDLVRYGATWHSYVMPPVEHPLLGAASGRYWATAGVGDGLLEQQLSLGWGVMALALVAIGQRLFTSRPSAPLGRVPVLVAVGIAAMLWSLAPAPASDAVAAFQPSVVLHNVLPVFRSYARFGSVVQLMAVLLAGIGIDGLLRAGTQQARALCGLLVLLTAAEYVVLPSALSRDVLPTAAHRWVMTQAPPIRVMDCVSPTAESESVRWLSGDRTSPLSVTVSDCNEPNLAQKLAANGYTHLLVRRDASPATARRQTARTGMAVAVSFPDARVYRVTAPRPAIYTGLIRGFSLRERDAAWSWRWFGDSPSWLVENTTAGPLLARLTLEAAAFHEERSVTLLLDGVALETLVVSPERRRHVTIPFLVTAGSHDLTFSPGEPPTVPDRLLHNHDRRPLSIAIGTWSWHVGGNLP